jgi:hypothetical protein
MREMTPYEIAMTSHPEFLPNRCSVWGEEAGWPPDNGGIICQAAADGPSRISMAARLARVRAT